MPTFQQSLSLNKDYPAILCHDFTNCKTIPKLSKTTPRLRRSILSISNITNNHSIHKLVKQEQRTMI